jgi:SecD/SecF fusion protein
MITSLTTILTIVVVFILGGEVIRGFAFALLLGIGIGTYSSVWIATPIVYETLGKNKEEDKDRMIK